MAINPIGGAESVYGASRAYNQAGQAARSAAQRHSPSPASETTFSPAVRIAAKYDLRSITPKQISQMADELLESGLIGFDQSTFLSFQPQLSGSHRDLISSFTGMMGSPDQPIDLLSEIRSALEAQQQAGASPQTLHRTQGLVDLLSNLDYMHSVAY